MLPPQGRIAVGDRVRVPDGRAGRVIRERLIHSNGAWKYLVALDDGGALEQFDYELRPLGGASEAGPRA